MNFLLKSLSLCRRCCISLGMWQREEPQPQQSISFYQLRLCVYITQTHTRAHIPSVATTVAVCRFALHHFWRAACCSCCCFCYCESCQCHRHSYWHAYRMCNNNNITSNNISAVAHQCGRSMSPTAALLLGGCQRFAFCSLYTHFILVHIYKSLYIYT